jgi:hypothetical protein
LSQPNIWEATQGVSQSFTIQVRDGAGNPILGQYAGTELLACVVWAGADQSAAANLTPTWVSGPLGTVKVLLSGAVTATVLAGLYEVSVQLADGSEMLWVGFLDLSPAAGTATYRSLAKLSDVQALLPDLFGNPHALDALPVALEAATRAIETYCRRLLVLTSFDRIYRPARTRKIQLHTWPVPILSRIKTDLAVVASITCSNTINQVATVQMTATGPHTNALATLTFSRIASGVPSTTTVGGLVSAINALGGGWAATVAAPFASWPVSELNANPGTFGGLDGLDLQAFTRDISRYNLDPINGVIELTENRPQAFRYADHSFGFGYGFGYAGASDPRYAGVRVQYRGGYAVSSGDVALGYQPVPADLRTACVMTAQAILEGVPAAGPVSEQAVKDRSYKLKDDHQIIPMSARIILGRYENARIF